jgi:hypothetical protein
MEKKTVGLDEVLNKYGVPDPRIVGKLPKGGMQLDFVGHADVTKMLIEIDSCWSWEPVAFDADGLPAYRVENGMAHMAGWLTVHGVRRLGIGSVAHNKPDLLKELASDFLRNAAMRFGVCLSLWTKQEWDDIDKPAPVAKPAMKPTAPKTGKITEANKPVPAEASKHDPNQRLSPSQVNQFRSACEARGIDPDKVAFDAGLGAEDTWTEADLVKLRAAYKKMSEAL